MSDKLMRFLRNLNLSPQLQSAFREDPAACLAAADLADDDRREFAGGSADDVRRVLALRGDSNPVPQCGGQSHDACPLL